MTYYGQFKQDEILNEEVFKGKRNGTFIEIGCADPVVLSNSYFFETEMNWTGLCIDARKSACEEFAKARKSRVINAAIGQNQGKSIFLDPGLGVLAGLVKYMSLHEFELMEKYTTAYEKISAYWVDVVPFEAIRRELPSANIDLLMIDTEGAEAAILKGIGEGVRDFSVVMAESNTRAAILEIGSILRDQGFEYYKSAVADHIYINKASDIFDSLNREKNTPKNG